MPVAVVWYVWWPWLKGVHRVYGGEPAARVVTAR